ncbi:MAG: M23 family metallopeptidase [Desulfomonile tiedjei]|nr:M23 family metallopeptidase [Desulfomonile tiedjei]
MRADRLYIKRISGRRVGPSALLAVFFVILLSGLVFGSYFCLFTPQGSQFPFACNLPSPPIPAGPNHASRPMASEPGSDVQQAAGSQEILGDTGEGDTLFSVLSANLPDEESAKEVTLSLASVIQKAREKTFDGLTTLEPGTRYYMVLDREGRFLQATVEIDPSNVFHAAVQDDTIRSWKEEVVLDFRVESISFQVKGSLVNSLLSIGEGMQLAGELTKVFQWDIDFEREAKRGDLCKVVFERRYADDRPSGYGRVLYAVYEGKRTGKKTAVLFKNEKHKDEYYSEKGEALKKDTLRTPLRGAIRVTSNYGRRFHPILRYWKHHQGVDYGAPKGTPVQCVAGGTVTFAGWKGDYGNYVCVKHDNGCESRYGHLSRIGVQKGQRVKQTQGIGLVGMTGLASGPHLHFEWLVNGDHKNPQKYKMIQTARCVAGPLKSRFVSIAAERERLLNPARATANARGVQARLSTSSSYQ